MRSIRVNVALSVFGVFVLLLVLQGVYVLDRVERGLWREVDQALLGELEEVGAMIAHPERLSALREEIRAADPRDELFVEIRERDGEVWFRSENVPPAGAPGAVLLFPGESPRFWEAVNPASRKQHRRVRFVGVELDGHEIRIGRSLIRVQTVYRRLRANLVSALLLMSSLGAAAAYLVAARALAPVRRIAERAHLLGVTGDGLLPRTGNEDEIDRLASVLNELIERQRNEVVRVLRLSADAGHAMRTPLAAIRGNLELAAARASGEAAEEIGMALELIDELASAVNDLLLLERLDQAPGDALERKPIDLCALARGVVDALRVLAQERGLTVELRCAPVPVLGDADQLQRAFLNLLDNALRHTPNGGRIDVEIEARDGRAFLRVRDSGPGLAAEELERVFERFYSRPTASGAGTGLGLPIARAIARAHGGELRASSPGGALFELELPAGES
jgi:signal transduction histidine kinase